MMGLVLATMAGFSALIGGLGIINYMNGATINALVSLVVPMYLGYWAWVARDNLPSEPLIPIFAFAWVCGAPIGVLVYLVHRTIS